MDSSLRKTRIQIVRSKLYSLRKLEQILPKSILKKVAEGLFSSNLRYALGLFCPIRLKDTDPQYSSINGIKVIYNDVLRLLCGSKRENRKPTEEILNETGWLSINQLSCEIRLIEVWKALNIDNYCLKDLFEKVPSTRVTRNSNKIRLKSGFKSRLRENSFQFPSVQLWNAAPESVTSAKTETMARNEIKSFVQSLPL